MITPADSVLVLDDTPSRLDWFKKRLWKPRNVTLTDSYEKALHYVSYAHYNVLYLDCDLGLDTEVNSKHSVGLPFESWSGEDFVHSLMEKISFLLWPREVVIHSNNPTGATNMAALLKNNGVPVVMVPYYLMQAACTDNSLFRYPATGPLKSLEDAHLPEWKWPLPNSAI